MNDPTSGTLKIVSLQAKNVLRLSAVRIEPDGNIVTLGGKNGAGKSSVLNVIAMAIGGKKLFPPQPVKEGEDLATIDLDLGDLMISRTISATKDTLLVKDAKGLRGTQTMLTALFDSLAFDPLAFSRMKAGAQAEALRVAMGVDFTELDDTRDREYESRTQVGREIKRIKGALDSITFHKDAPAEPVSVAELSDEMDRRRAVNRENEQARISLASASDNVLVREEDIEETRAELARLEKRLVGEKKDHADLVEKVKSLTDADTEEIADKLRNADVDNAMVRSNAEHRKLSETLEGFESDRAQLTATIDAIGKEKLDTLAAVDFPVDGLTFGADGVELDGLPFEQASTAQQLWVSVAVGIASNPKLRVMMIRDGSLLDPDSLTLVHAMAEEHDCQFWIEDARTDDPSAIIIEDGEIRE